MRQRQRAAGQGQSSGPMAIPITPRALRQRVERRLRQTGRRLIVRPAGCFIIAPGATVGTRIDLEGHARGLGVIQPWEQVVGDGDGGGR